MVAVRSTIRDTEVFFGHFRLDTDGQLWHGTDLIPIRPKPFAVLNFLLERAGRLVTKDELLDAIWPDVSVGEAVLKKTVGEIRDALSDEPRSPGYIETAHRRGYRFIADVTVRPTNSAIQAKQPAIEQDQELRIRQSTARPKVVSRTPAVPATTLVGRQDVMNQMMGWLDSASRGERRIVFATGEAGIGKTAMVEAFLQCAGAQPETLVAHGQCLEQYGASEPFMPVLEALGRLSRGPGRDLVVASLRRAAPLWLAQLPWLADPSDNALADEILPGPSHRMLREIAEAIELLTWQTRLVMVIEDLHWSDYSTLDLISHLARRIEPARLLFIATYRPIEAIVSQHPLKTVKQELQIHRQCDELALKLLTEAAVTDYVRARFEGLSLAAELARLIYSRTEGNPLFMVGAADYMVDQGLIVRGEQGWRLTVGVDSIHIGVPDGIAELIDKQIGNLSPDQRLVLEAAGVAGMEFSAAAVAAAIGYDEFQVEEHCDRLARRNQFLKLAGIAELPGGGIAARYAFLHSLHQNAFYNHVSPSRRTRLHQRIREYEESFHQGRIGEIAADLIVRCEEARDYQRAVKYIQVATDNAPHQSAWATPPDS